MRSKLGQGLVKVVESLKFQFGTGTFQFWYFIALNWAMAQLPLLAPNAHRFHTFPPILHPASRWSIDRDYNSSSKPFKQHAKGTI